MNVEKAIQENAAELTRKALKFAEEKGLNEKHRLIMSPVCLEVAGGKVKVHRHVDVEIEGITTPKPRIIVPRAVSVTTEA